MRRVRLGLLLLLSLAGCTSFDRAMHSLNERQVAGCYRVHIQGGGALSQVQGAADGLIVTGGVTLAECASALEETHQ
jgi:hypothetical protein